MSANHDITRVVRSWIREDEHDSADHILQVVLSRLGSTPQRRSSWPARRFQHMNVFTKATIAAAAALVVAVIGYQLLPGDRPGAGSVPTAAPPASPAPSATPSLTARPSPTAQVVPPIGDLVPGRHPFRLEGVSFTLDIPAGWESNGSFAITRTVGIVPEGAGFIFWEDDADGVFSDPCTQTQAPPVRPSAADMAAAIADMPQIELVSGPTAITLGGQPGQQVVIRIPDNLPCASDRFHLWYDETIAGNARYASNPGDTIRVWIVEVDGVRVQMDGETYAGAPAEVGDEVQAIVESIRFE